MFDPREASVEEIFELSDLFKLAEEAKNYCQIVFNEHILKYGSRFKVNDKNEEHLVYDTQNVFDVGYNESSFHYVKIYINLNGRLRFVEKYPTSGEIEEIISCDVGSFYSVLKDYYLRRKDYTYPHKYHLTDMDLHLRNMIVRTTTKKP